MNANPSVLTMYAVTPCHAGSGSTIGIVDSPIQRERHTNWPIVASSGVKGAMRAHIFNFEKKGHKSKVDLVPDQNLTNFIFGFDKEPKNVDVPGYAGAITVSDMKILAFPMRSNVAPFVWITCPAVLNRLIKDLKLTGKITDKNKYDKITNIEGDDAWSWKGDLVKEILLEDMEVKVNLDGTKMPEILERYFEKADHLLVINDKVFDYGVSQCTSITAQIKIDQATGTTANGSLRYQEELPADTIMYCLIFWGDSRDVAESMKMITIKDFMTREAMKDFIQVGGDETCGRGIFELDWNEDKGGVE